MTERLRKRAFDSGTFTLLTYIYNELKNVEENPFKAIRQHIKEQILNYATITDLTYHTKLLSFIIDNPQLTENPSFLHFNASSALGERKGEENADESAILPEEQIQLMSETSVPSIDRGRYHISSPTNKAKASKKESNGNFTA